jgi:hypothetical protein
MSTQLKLPAQWPLLETRRDPRDRLEALHKDVLVAKAEIREVLDRLAERHGISARDITYSMDGYADDMLSDATYGLSSELEREAEAQDPV